jgi:hypothetical protein
MIPNEQSNDLTISLETLTSESALPTMTSSQQLSLQKSFESVTKLTANRAKVAKGIEYMLLDAGMGGDAKGDKAVTAAWEAVGWYEDE